MQPISSFKINFFFFFLLYKWPLTVSTEGEEVSGGNARQFSAAIPGNANAFPTGRFDMVGWGYWQIINYFLTMGTAPLNCSYLLHPFTVFTKKKPLFKSVVFVGKNMWLVHLLLWLGCFLLSISLFVLHYRNCRNWYLSLLDLIAVFPFE